MAANKTSVDTTLNPASNPAPSANHAVNLHEFAGLDATLTPPELSLTFGTDVQSGAAETRYAPELSPVLRDAGAARPDDLLYVAYRGVTKSESAEEMIRRGLMYVVLSLREGTVGEERTRTRGHFNSSAPGTSAAYPEVHEVWHGNGLLYLQSDASDTVREVVVIPLAPGDKAVVAPGWASLLVNAGGGPLVVGSWRTFDCVVGHELLEARGGMAHFLLEGADGETVFETNNRYENVPAPRHIAPHDMADFGLRRDEPMLTTFRRNPDFLRFMLRPQDYARVWSGLYKGDEGA